MEPTIRISIGGFAFTFEESAYKLLSEYFDKLKDQLKSEESSDETVNDIEYRISELLRMRLENRNRTVNYEDVAAILKIMGNPEEYGIGEEDPESEYKVKQNIKEKSSRRLYRDKANGIIGGVCSGLSHYFRVDVVLVRLIFIIPLMFCIFSFGCHELVAGEIILYIALWFIAPNAGSFEQKVSMTGSGQPIGAGETYNSKKYKGSGIRDFLNAVYKIFLILIIIMSSIFCIGIIASTVWFSFENNVVYVDNYISLMGFDGLQIKTATLLLLIIPAIGLLALSIKLLRNTPFRASSLVIFLLGFGVWIAAAVYTGGLGFRYALQTRSSANVKEDIKLTKDYDTIYIALGENYNNARLQPNNPDLLYRNRVEGKGNDICILEHVMIVEDESIDDYQIRYTKTAYANDYANAYSYAKNLKSHYIIQDSLITLNPEWHNFDNPWDLSSRTLYIKVPKNKIVKRLGYLEDIYRRY